MQTTFLTVCWVALITLMLLSPAQAQSTSLSTSIVGLAAPVDPLDAAVGVTITQITNVDQKSENFGVVARIRMEWQDDKLAFDANEVGRDIQVMAASDFLAYARRLGTNLPVATIENQQTRSFDKTALVAWSSDGKAFFVREFTTTLQAPDFDFRHYPFDKQTFYLRLLANTPSEFVQFSDLPGGSGMGDQLGEEEWVITSVWTEVDEVEGVTGLQSSRFSLGFSAHRHLLYYWARLFVPLLLLLGVAWANLFLEEYRRRIDIASGNLLAFIAYNFAISGELPRLGYLTFLDALMLAMFVITSSAVAYNVMLRRLSLAEREQQARALDWHVTIWGFPAIIFVTVLLIYAWYFL